MRTFFLVSMMLVASGTALAGEPKPGFQLPVGNPAPGFSLRTLDGTMVRLDELAYNGKEKSWAKKRTLMVDFFRTDCGPCRASLPELVGLYNDYKPKGLDVVLVAPAGVKAPGLLRIASGTPTLPISWSGARLERRSIRAGVRYCPNDGFTASASATSRA